MPWSTSTRPGSTRASRALRTWVLDTHPTCYLQYPGCTGTSTEDDHVIPVHLRPDLDLDPDNHRGACHPCHAIKTRREAQAAKPSRQRKPEPHPGNHHTQ